MMLALALCFTVLPALADAGLELKHCCIMTLYSKLAKQVQKVNQQHCVMQGPVLYCEPLRLFRNHNLTTSKMVPLWMFGNLTKSRGYQQRS